MNSDGLNEYKIVSYDQELCEKASMHIDEDQVRQSLHHKPESFTYDASDQRLHKLLLDQLILVPGHDLNNDGFINEDDVRRDDLTLALVANDSYKPLMTMTKHTEDDESDLDNDDEVKVRQRSVYEAHGVNMEHF